MNEPKRLVGSEDMDTTSMEIFNWEMNHLCASRNKIIYRTAK